MFEKHYELISQGTKQSVSDLLFAQQRHSWIQHALLPSDVIDFVILPARRILMENSFSLRRHVTLRLPLLGEILVINSKQIWDIKTVHFADSEWETGDAVLTDGCI